MVNCVLWPVGCDNNDDKLKYNGFCINLFYKLIVIDHCIISYA